MKWENVKFIICGKEIETTSIAFQARAIGPGKHSITFELSEEEYYRLISAVSAIPDGRHI